MTTFTTVVDLLAFPEGPRWHDGALWFSDMQGGSVMRVVPGEPAQKVVDVPELPSGLGWLPSGELLVVSMHDRTVFRLTDQGLVEHADLTDLATGNANDMLVDDQGRAYVGNFGDESVPPDPVTPGVLALIHPDGRVVAAADGLELANGMALVDGGSTLVVAETRAIPPKISTFTVAADGTLSNREVLIELTNELPDGLCADADDSIWFASPFTNELINVSRAGDIVLRVPSTLPPYACALGGDDGRTLFVCASESWIPEVARASRTGKILALHLDDLELDDLDRAGQ